MIQFQLFQLLHSRLFCPTYLALQLPSISRQYSWKISFPRKMSSGRNSRLTRESGIRRETVGVDGSSPDISTDVKGEYSHVRGQNLQRTLGGIVSPHPVSSAASDSAYDKEYPPLSASNVSGSKAKRRSQSDVSTQHEQRLEERPRDIDSSQREASSEANLRSNEQKTFQPTSYGNNCLPPSIKRHKFWRALPGRSVVAGKTDSAKGLPMLESFDICLTSRSSTMDDSLNAKNNEKQIELEESMERTVRVLRPGMVLLKSYITQTEQVQIVKICRKLGLGPGGFYQPRYRDGAKLRLQMMCLGLDWDPETRRYDNHRVFDGSEPPAIPHELNSLVKRAIQYSHAFIEKSEGLCNVEDILPDMSPNICIVNFYTTRGRLGLHQDRDESKESLYKGLPVVSFSIGDSADFLYGEQRDADKAEEVLLESGDVLIFGGQSRHIFHGVPSIIPNSAPPALLEETKLRPGRLNLTFRQY